MDQDEWGLDNEKPGATRLKFGPERKRKWRPVDSEAGSLSQTQQTNDDVTLGSKYPKFGGRESSLRQARSSNYNTHTDVTILELPNELLGYITLYLNGRDIGRLAATCLRLNEVISQAHIWRCLCRSHFPFWNNQKQSDLSNSNAPLYGHSWKRQYSLNYTKSIRYQYLGSGNAKRRVQSAIADVTSAYGLKKLSCSRDHVFALDHASYLHVYRWERETVTNDFVYKRVDWHHDFAKHVIDVTTDPRYDNNHRRYVYVLTQSEAMRSRRFQPLTRSTSTTNNGWDGEGNSIAGDKIDVFDERTCRRVFNMTFDPEMRFVSMKLTSLSPHQKTLYILTDAGKVYSLHLYESSLLNLGSEGMQVTLKSVSKNLGEKVSKIETSVSVVAFLTESGKLYVVLQRKSEFSDIFGRDVPVKLAVPYPIPHVAKVVSCSIGDRHLGFIDEYNRGFMVGNNRYGQLGTGDRMDRNHPVQILFNKTIRILYCSLNHSLAVVESDDHCVMLGTGCGNSGRLPGNARGSVEFVKLDVTVPWSAIQVDAHKECVFLLSCYDVDNPIQYKKQPASKHVAGCLFLKSQQELFIDMKKTTSLADKARILEAMIEKTTRLNSEKQKVCFSLKGSEQRSKGISQSRLQEKKAEFNLTDDLRLLREAVEHMRLTAERVELDKQILSGQKEAL